ncbi:MAG TPA: glutaredoxin domain-containing protein [Thermomicrobiales bacterium]|nr:glutaredoxin domain-containing protein [Thermomicrobiales bacterium]
MVAGAEPLTLFTQDGCPDSARVRTCLLASGVPFVERNLSREPLAAAALLATGLFATPVVVAGAQTLLAARRDQLAAALGFVCRCSDGGH